MRIPPHLVSFVDEALRRRHARFGVKFTPVGELKDFTAEPNGKCYISDGLNASLQISGAASDKFCRVRCRKLDLFFKFVKTALLKHVNNQVYASYYGALTWVYSSSDRSLSYFVGERNRVHQYKVSNALNAFSERIISAELDLSIVFVGLDGCRDLLAKALKAQYADPQSNPPAGCGEPFPQTLLLAAPAKCLSTPQHSQREQRACAQSGYPAPFFPSFFHASHSQVVLSKKTRVAAGWQGGAA